ncbi:O-antigen ligase family protein [uncultured Nocardioides sp.]|uniref:O-antigen ligase family protein n=1 Tax=uncultured Nocardioides sp. TaxID=198441 RepID=UPI00260E3A8B|nr:O-antigen ligase family protein [uncultured Nocardioides sp.]
MTTLAPPAHPTPHEPDPTTDRRPGRLGSLRAWLSSWLPSWLPDAAVVALLAWWATYLTWGTGGREPHLLSVACVLAALAWVAVRPERTLSPWALLPSAALAAGACLVVAFSPTGWAGRDDAGAWVLAAATGLVLLAWAGGPVDSGRTEVRRTLLVLALLGAGGAQFAAGWLPWWGAQDPEKLFQGTFYWHNQVGIFLAVIGILALAVAGSGGPLALLGWVVAPLCVAGTFFSTSRGSQLSLLLGFALVLALIGGRALLPRVKVLLAGALGVAVSVLLTGPPFFAERVSPAAGTAARSESFVGNGVTRLEDWAAAWQVFERWPLTGAGFDGFRAATEAVGVGHRAGRTAYVHNGFLQGLTDGGLLLGLPLLLVTLVLAVAVCRGLPTVVRRGEAVRVGAGAALLALVLHSGMDFDWAYPSLLLLPALVAPLALGPVTRAHMRTAWWPSVLAVALLATGAWWAWGGGLSLNAPVG